MDLIDKQNIVWLQVCKNRRKIAGALENGPGSLS